MPPKRIAGEPRSKASKNIIATTYSALTSPENASVVGSVAMFGAAIAFLASPWSEYLLSPI